MKWLCEGKSITEVKSYLAPSLGSKGISAKTNSKVSREEVVGEKKVIQLQQSWFLSLSCPKWSGVHILVIPVNFFFSIDVNWDLNKHTTAR